MVGRSEQLEPFCCDHISTLPIFLFVILELIEPIFCLLRAERLPSCIVLSVVMGGSCELKTANHSLL